MTTKNINTPASAPAPATATAPTTTGQVHDAVQREITAGIEAMARAGDAMSKHQRGKFTLADGTVVERR